MPGKGRPFEKGKVANPHGRPKKGHSFTDILERVLRERQVEYAGEMISGKEAAARKLLELALLGDVAALKYLADRIDGSPRASVDTNVSGGLSYVVIPDAPAADAAAQPPEEASGADDNG